MASFIVGAPGTLEEVLAIHGVQPWRTRYLITCSGVTVERHQARLDLTVDGPTTPLHRDDVVNLPDPAPAPCAAARQAIANFPAAYRDYALVAPAVGPNDTHIHRLARFFDIRDQTIRLQPSSGSLKEFIDMVKSDSAIKYPVRDLMVGAHASPHGGFSIAPTPGAVANINYEKLEDAVAKRTLIVPPEVLQPRPKDAKQQEVPARFIIRGCAIGEAAPVLRKLKEALGGALQVVAPKYEHALGSFSGPGGEGLYEFLAYEFEVFSPTPLATDQDVVNAFIAKGFKDYTGQPIPNKTWPQWVPKGAPQNFHKELKLRSSHAGRDVLAMAFFRVEQEPFVLGEIPVNVPQDPGSDSARRAALVAYFEAEPRFKSTHAWPGYVRYGYSSVAEMVAGHTWTFRHNASAGRLFCKGTRMTFLVHQPILDARGELIHNFFPIRPPGKPKETFTDREPAFFAAV